LGAVVIGSHPGKPWRMRSAFMTGLRWPQWRSIICMDVCHLLGEEINVHAFGKAEGRIGVPEAIGQTAAGVRTRYSANLR
jgi:hypothetical protein